MYAGSTILTALLVVSCCRVDTATGSILRRSLYSRQEDDRDPAATPMSTTHVCTEDKTRTVRCRPSRNDSGISMCCSLSWSTGTVSNLIRPPCTAAATDFTNHTTILHSTPTNCTLSIPASTSNNRRKRSLVSYELLTCSGSSLEVRCRVNLSCSDRVSWRRAGQEATLEGGRDLRIQDVQLRDSGTYHCEVTDFFGKTRLGAVVVVATQFPPVLKVPTPRPGRPLECISESNPPSTITWYRDSEPLLPGHHEESPFPEWYIVSSETEDCTTRSRLRLLPPTEENATRTEMEAANYTCVAVNRHGQAELTIALTDWPDDQPSVVSADLKRRFNVTGFIVGMLPPLFISFYIILKLGYRSRYAEERGEDDGFGEEPFFIGY